MVAKTKKKEYEYIRIISLDGSVFFDYSEADIDI